MIPPLVCAILAMRSRKSGFIKLGLGEAQLAPLPEDALVPEPKHGLLEVLEQVTLEQLVPGLKSRPDGLSVKAGLYQVHNYLDVSHELCQQADDAGPNTTAPYWHGIMHRREPDYDNARYWFRRVGTHEIFQSVGREVAEFLRDETFAGHLRFDRVVDRLGHWDAMAFVDLCEECGVSLDERAQAAAKLQSIEMRVLLEYTCRAAQGEL